MDHQAAHHDVVRAIRSVEGLGGYLGERAVRNPRKTAGVGDRLVGGIHPVGGAVGRDGGGHRTGEGSTTAAGVEHVVPWAGAALSGQPREHAAAAAPEEDGAVDVVAATMCLVPKDFAHGLSTLSRHYVAVNPFCSPTGQGVH